MENAKLHHPQAWKETSPGHWQRPLAGMEPYFVFFGNLTASLVEGREHYKLFSSVKIERATQDISALQHAWKQLRYEQPGLACTADGTANTLNYEVPNEESLEQWVADTFKVVDTSLSTSELYPDLEPIKYPTLYWLPQSSELALRMSHWKMDGVGMLLFWNAYFTALATPETTLAWGKETAKLAPTMEDIWGYDVTPTPEQAEEAQKLITAWASALPGCGPVSQLGKSAPAKCRNAELEFDAETTSAIVAASKARGLSVTTSIHAAWVLANLKHADPALKDRPYVGIANFDLRKYLGAPYETDAFAINLYYTPIPVLLPLPASFDDVAKGLKTFYATTYANNIKMQELTGHFTRSLLAATSAPEFLSGPVPSDPYLSSLGIVERYVKREYANGVRITDFHFAGDVVMGMTALYLYTFDNRMRLAYSFNDGFQAASDIQAMLESTKEIIIRELGVKGSAA